jgi:hypothetical protein
MSRVPYGRSNVIRDTGTRLEIEKLWAALQDVKIQAAQVDADDVAPAIGSAMRTGQLEVLNEVLDGVTPFNQIRVGSAGGKLVAIERASEDVSGQNVPANGVYTVTFTGLSTVLLSGNDDVIPFGSINDLPDELTVNAYRDTVGIKMQIQNHTGSIKTIAASTTASVVVFYFAD